MKELKEIMLAAGFSDAGVCIYNDSFLLADSGKNKEIKMIPKSIICGMVPYYQKEQEGQNISLYAVSRDYHLVLTEYMNHAISMFEKKYSEYHFEGFCDNSPINEVKSAISCGLGMRGKNNLFIHSEYGSYVNLCTILTDMPFSYEIYPSLACENCGRCIDVCPGEALSLDGFLRERCLSYITQKKGDLLQKEAELLKKGERIWGCDLCQKVCPHNKKPALAETQPPHIYRLEEEDIEGLSNKAFKEKYKEYAFSWRGKETLLRNIKIKKKKEISR